MTLRQYIGIMVFATLLCWVSWGFVLLNVDPFAANRVNFIFFYLSLFFSLLGTFSLLAFGFYRIFSRANLAMFRYVEKSFRDGLIISGTIIALLYLKGNDWLNNWNLAILLTGVLFLAGFFFFDNKYKQSQGQY